MAANGAVALSTTVDHHDVVNRIYGLIFGLSIAIDYNRLRALPIVDLVAGLVSF
jgi:hypothetical protein